MLSRFVLFLFLAATSGAMGGQADMGGVSVNLPPPPGYCDLSDSRPSDTRMLSVVGGLLGQSGNKLLSISAECGQLADWRSNKRLLLDDYAQYQSSITAIGQAAPADMILDTCAYFRAVGDKLISNNTPDIKARVEAALKTIKLSQTTFIGVLDEEPRACYAGITQQIHMETGIDKAQLAVLAVTVVKNRAIFVYRFAVNKDSDTVANELAKLKDNVAALHAAN